MALQILNAGPAPEEIATKLREAVEARLPGAQVEITAAGPGHYEIRVVSELFRDKSRVQQQQLVYGAITPLMSGKDAPVHAVDKMECVAP